MKSLFTAIILAIIIVVGSLIYTNNLDDVSKTLINGNEVVRNLIIEENYSGAEHVISEISNFIEKKRLILTATGNHDEINKIELHIAELLEFVRAEQYADSISHSAALNTLFENMPKNYKLTLGNIL